MDVGGKQVLILGLAREGVSLARFLAGHGAHVTVTDSASVERLAPRVRSLGGLPVELALGGDHPELVSRAEVFLVSPGVPEWNPVYVAAREAGLPVQSMTTLFFELCPGTIAGITGSSGKTTTTGLTGHMLERAGRDVVVGGNIGDPMLDLLSGIGPGTIVVLELSSFQLSLLRRSPHIAAVTNITPNHLDRHGTMAEYIAAKRHIVEHQQPGDHAVLNAGDAAAAAFAAATPARARWFGMQGSFREGAATRAEWAGLLRDGTFVPVIRIEEIPLLGRHNVENVLAAMAMGDILGVAADRMAEGAASYRPAPHRLQTVSERGGVRYVDDSIATSPARASVALDSIAAPVILIAGGRDKNLPWDDFARLAVHKVRALLLIGEAAPVIREAVERELAGSAGSAGSLRAEAVRRCASLAEAVCTASRLARPGDVVLLSPGCASYDMFSDFEERGAAFVDAVEALDAA